MQPQAGAAAQAIAVGGRQRDAVAAGAQRAAVEIAEPRGIGPAADRLPSRRCPRTGSVAGQCPLRR